jgi:hypothetical protein
VFQKFKFKEFKCSVIEDIVYFVLISKGSLV